MIKHLMNVGIEPKRIVQMHCSAAHDGKALVNASFQYGFPYDIRYAFLHESIDLLSCVIVFLVLCTNCSIVQDNVAVPRQSASQFPVQAKF